MKRKKERAYYLLTLFMVMLTIQSCHDNDCLIPLPDKTDFQTPLEIDSNICNVIASINSDKSALTRNSDYSFETELFNLYGLPIWTNPVVFTESDKIVYLIPIIDNNDDEEINAILYFVMDSLYTDYFVYTRQQAISLNDLYNMEINDLWMFDYFTQTILNKTPKNGLIFKDREYTQTRGLITIEACVDAYILEGEWETFVGTHCWSYYLMDFTQTEEGSSSVGGTTNQGYGGGNTQTTPPQLNDSIQKKPCDISDMLSSDMNFVSKVTNYLNEISIGGTENGWIKLSNKNYINPIKRMKGGLKYDYTQIGGYLIQERYHTHPTGAPYPSWSDLSTIADNYRDGYIDINNFSYGVISHFGCLTLIITHKNKFNVFMKNLKNCEIAFNKMTTDDTRKDIEYVIGKFIKFLNTSDSGMTVLLNRATWNDDDKYSLDINWVPQNVNDLMEIFNFNCID